MAEGKIVNSIDLVEFISDFKRRYGIPLSCITVTPEIHEMLKQRLERLTSSEVTTVDIFYGVRVYVDINQHEPIKIGRDDSWRYMAQDLARTVGYLRDDNKKGFVSDSQRLRQVDKMIAAYRAKLKRDA